MRTLILVRHAKAVRPTEAPSDRARGLTERGKREAREAGEAIAALDARPMLAVVSPSVRTRETFEHLAAALPWKPRLVIADAIYEAEPEDIWEEALDAAGDDEDAGVIVVGHNPGMTELVARLLRQARDRSPAASQLAEHVPTSGFAAFTLTGSTLQAAGATLIGWGRLKGE
ncbi:MAG: histidine phosphatase family protein [Hyphomonadaceae bacterium]